MTFPCPHCRKPVPVADQAILSAAARINSSKRKTHGAGSGRPRIMRRCPRCGRKHSAREMPKCRG